MKDYLTIQEAAAFLEMPIESVYKNARTKKLPASKVGRYWRFDRDKLAQWKLFHRVSNHHELQVMVVDDEPLFRDLISTWLRSMGHVVDTTPDGEIALEFLTIQQYDLVFLDLQMPKANGVDVLRSFKQIDLMDEAMRLGTLTVLKKPFSRENLVQVVNEHLARKVYA